MDLMVHAEVRKLAEELACDPEDLDFLMRFDADDLAQLRHVVYHALDEKFRPVFQRLELAARLVPNPITARIAMRHFSPLVLGRTATELSADRALKLLPQLPNEFIADCSPYMDPVRAKPIMRGMPIDVILPVARIVIERRDHVALGRMLAGLLPEHIPHVIGLVQDGHDVILIAFHSEDTDVLDPVATHLSDEQVLAVVTAAVEHELVEELAYVLSHVSEANRERLVAAAHDDLVAALFG